MVHFTVAKSSTDRVAAESMAPDAKDAGMTAPASGIAQGIPVGISNRCADGSGHRLCLLARSAGRATQGTGMRA